MIRIRIRITDVCLFSWNDETSYQAIWERGGGCRGGGENWTVTEGGHEGEFPSENYTINNVVLFIISNNLLIYFCVFVCFFWLCNI